MLPDEDVVVTVTAVRDRAARRQFVDFPYVLYRGDRHWIPQPRVAEHARFAARHPFFAHADVELLTARDAGRTVGRIAAIDDRLHNAKHDDNLAAFGHFEAETEEAARALLAAAESWAKARGRSRLRGPLNSSLNETAGLLVDAFDADPMVMMPYNPPRYAAYIEAAGFRKAKDLFAWIIDSPGETVPERVVGAGERFQSRHHLTIRSVNMSAFKQEIARFVEVYCRAWGDNWGFVDPTSEEVHQMATELRYIVDTDLVIAAEVEGRMVGCAIALPDLNQTFKGTGGRLFPLGLLRLLARRRIVTQARVLLFGVVPEWRKTGLAAALIVELISRIGRRYRRAELSWVLEDNDLTNNAISLMGGRHYKTYRVYEKDIA
jgi:GNAT superfamily N-acetyltransferase